MELSSLGTRLEARHPRVRETTAKMRTALRMLQASQAVKSINSRVLERRVFNHIPGQAKPAPVKAVRFPDSLSALAIANRVIVCSRRWYPQILERLGARSEDREREVIKAPYSARQRHRRPSYRPCDHVVRPRHARPLSPYERLRRRLQAGTRPWWNCYRKCSC